MTVEIKRPGGTEIVLTGPGAEVCVVLNTLLDRRKPETTSTSGVKLTEEEDIRLTQLYHEGYRWLAREESGDLYAFKEEPGWDWDGNSWGARMTDGFTDVPIYLFSFVSSQDEEPTAIEPIIRAMILEDAHAD